MSCDSESDMSNITEFCGILDNVNATAVKYGIQRNIIGGDFNTDFQRKDYLHTFYLEEYMQKLSLVNCLSHRNMSVDYTFESKMSGAKSTIDHILILCRLMCLNLFYHMKLYTAEIIYLITRLS